MTQRLPISAALVLCSLLIGLSSAARAEDAPKTGGKLMIVKAVYGDLPNGQSTDVTEKVAGMVKDNVLAVDATNENFTDPAEGVLKKLRVDYTIAGVAGTMSVNENETLKLSGDAPPAVIAIIKAVYGDLPNGQSTDVTQKVAAMVMNNALKVDATNDNFGDPAEGVVKKLQVDYTLDGKPATLTVNENETLTLPAAKPAGGPVAIVKALYGDLPDGQSTDVTQKVAAMLKDTGLSVEATNDNFGDPAEGVVKKLRIDYTVGGVAKSKTVGESETLTISSSGE